MAVRIRFRITEQTNLFYSPTAKRLTFAAVTDASIPPEERLTLGSLDATFTLNCDNPAALALLTLGSEQDFVITPAGE